MCQKTKAVFLLPSFQEGLLVPKSGLASHLEKDDEMFVQFPEESERLPGRDPGKGLELVILAPWAERHQLFSIASRGGISCME